MNLFKGLCFTLFLISHSLFAAPHIVRQGDLQLWTEDYGDPKRPAVVLLMGAGLSADYWPASWCQKLSEQGYHVIRFDWRDTGQSTHYDFQKRPYALDDLTQDVVILLDYYKLSKAHFVGFSMGGVVLQKLSFSTPSRVSSLALISTTAYHAPLLSALEGHILEPDLVPPEPIFVAKINQFLVSKPKNKSEKLEQLLLFWKEINGKGAFNQSYWRELHKKAFEREFPLVSNDNHVLAQKSDGEDRKEQLKKVQVPSLVIQGQYDPFFPKPHGLELASSLLATYVEIPNMGHTFDPEYEAQISSALLTFWKNDALAHHR